MFNTWTHSSVVKSCAFSKGDIENYMSITRRHLEIPTLCSWDYQPYPEATWPCPSPNHEGSQVFLSIQDQRSYSGKPDVVSLPAGPGTLSILWISPKTSQQMHKTDPWPSPPPPHVFIYIMAGHAIVVIKDITFLSWKRCYFDTVVMIKWRKMIRMM